MSLVPAGPCRLRPTITHFRSRESDDQTGSLRKTLPNPGGGISRSPVWATLTRGVLRRDGIPPSTSRRRETASM